MKWQILMGLGLGLGLGCHCLDAFATSEIGVVIVARLF